MWAIEIMKKREKMQNSLEHILKALVEVKKIILNIQLRAFFCLKLCSDRKYLLTSEKN
jgi:hypothetical protein